MDDDFFKTFERAFQSFLDKGGFTLPCLSEQTQRQFMQNKPRIQRKCRHGLHPATCTVCLGEQGWAQA